MEGAMAQYINDLQPTTAAEIEPAESGTTPEPTERLPKLMTLLAWTLPGPLESPALLLVAAKSLKVPR
jgi:hypothetical protein